MSDNNSKSMGDLFPDLGPEAPVISGVAHDRSEEAKCDTVIFEAYRPPVQYK